MTDQERQRIVGIVEDYLARHGGAADLVVSDISPAIDGYLSATPEFVVRVAFKIPQSKRESILSNTPPTDRNSLAEFMDAELDATILVRADEVTEFRYDHIQLS